MFILKLGYDPFGMPRARICVGTKKKSWVLMLKAERLSWNLQK
jgi:hypothetical protein